MVVVWGFGAGGCAVKESKHGRLDDRGVKALLRNRSMTFTFWSCQKSLDTFNCLALIIPSPLLSLFSPMMSLPVLALLPSLLT